MKNIDLVIIGGGPAGMAAAVSAYKNGITDILMLDRSASLGGILQQCIHNGFGLHRFNKELTGPEYSAMFEEEIAKYNIPYKLNSMVIDVTSDKTITYVNEEEGVVKVQAKAIILAMGCRERSRGALNIAGSRPAGIYSAGTAQNYVNLKGYLPGKNIVILGSGDIGLIMARRMTLEGAKVEMVLELMPYSGGLNRNIVQCLNDFDIPLKLSHTIVKIHGKERVSGVTIAKVDENRKPIKDSYQYVPCDSVFMSVGLIPENELAKKAAIPIDGVTGGAVVDEGRQTDIDGIFECGNALHVHDLVDYVSEEAEIAGLFAARYIKGNNFKEKRNVSLVCGEGIRYVIPQKFNALNNDKIKLFFRVANVEKNVKIVLKENDTILAERKKKIIAPGEMEYLTITPAISQKIKGDKITLEIKKEDKI